MTTVTEKAPITAQSIRKDGPQILQEVDAAHIFQTHPAREFPRFAGNELQLGSLLGSGGFSNVYEIENIELISSSSDNNSDGTSLPKNADDQEHHHHREHEDHYEVDTARVWMSQHAQRMGSARYALKRLRDDLSHVDQARGALDLAIEIQFLSTLWHPNIIKMRGFSQSEQRISQDTFLVLDRLYGTLEDKMEVWETAAAQFTACCGGRDYKSPPAFSLLQERILVMYDLTCALQYVHERRLVYRDLKPENLGFDIRGDLKVFDFGLCKSLEAKDKVENGYKLSVLTGSIPYMAPEVALKKPYNTNADVYSFAILLWEVMGLQWAFNGFDTREYLVQVCVRNLRLPVQRGWPAMIRVLIQEGWDRDPNKRPTMKRMGTLLRAELKDLSNDLSIVDRTQHMMNRSRRSMRGSNSTELSRRPTLRSSLGRRESFFAGNKHGGGGLATQGKALAS